MGDASSKSAKPKPPVMTFATSSAFRRWLKTNQASHPGIWLQIAKKGSGHKSVTYAEALDEALCFGWIDGQKQSHDDQWFRQKFTRRGPRSIWSKINVGHVARLTKEGRMHASGQAAVDAAKADGRWERAYASFSEAEIPADFIAALAPDPRALAFFETLNRTNRYAIFFRLASAKQTETRARRFATFVAMMKRGEKFH